MLLEAVLLEPMLLEPMLLEAMLLEAMLLEPVLLEPVLLEPVLLEAVLLEVVLLFPAVTRFIFTHVNVLSSRSSRSNLAEYPVWRIASGKFGRERPESSQLDFVALGFHDRARLVEKAHWVGGIGLGGSGERGHLNERELHASA